MALRCVRLLIKEGVLRARASVQGRRAFQTIRPERVPLPLKPGKRLSLIPLPNHRPYNSSAYSSKCAEAQPWAGHEGGMEMFPWREAPVEAPVGKNGPPLLRLFRWLATTRGSLAFPMLVDRYFNVGVEAAFVGVAAALFKMRSSDLRDNVRSATTSEHVSELRSPIASALWSVDPSKIGEGDNDDNVGFSPDTVDSRLADFVHRTGKATLARGAVPHYRLHDIHTSRPYNVTVVVGCSREEFATTEKRPLEHDDVPVVVFVSDQQRRDRNIVNSMLKDVTENTTVRVDVDVACKETFFVKDRETNKVIQGSEDPKVRVHRLRLEARRCFLPDARWLVIDLDNWLDGNRYW